MKSLHIENLIPIGFISKSHGYKGEVVLIVEGVRAEDVSQQKFLFIQLEGLPVPFAIENVKDKSGDLIVKFEFVTDETEARKLSHKKVFAEKIKSNPEENWNWTDLVGYAVTDTEYGQLGKIEEVQEFPQQMIAKCTVNGKEILFPLNETIVIEIDDAKKSVLVELPDGLLEIYLND